MPTTQEVCPKCKSQMSEGFILDQGYRLFVSQWVEGPPEKGSWLGMKLTNKRMINTTTYRCVSCGYLESYAK
jgi:predicted nucleic-acid-binding Zn-ribbon protein